VLADGGADLASNFSSVLILKAAAPMPTASSLPLLPSCPCLPMLASLGFDFFVSVGEQAKFYHGDDRALLLLLSDLPCYYFLI